MNRRIGIVAVGIDGGGDSDCSRSVFAAVAAGNEKGNQAGGRANRGAV